MMPRMTRRRFLTLSACALAASPAHAATWQGRALGADVAVTLTGDRAAVDMALNAIPTRLTAIEAQFSLYRDSALTRLNTTGTLTPSKDFTTLMAQARHAHALTDGLFDPTVQPLWHALAMGRDPKPARALIGLDRVTLTPTIQLAPGQQLTLNGIAQGFATDLIRHDLAAQGFTRALIDMGEQAALGGPFTLGLEDQTQGPLGQLTLTNAARATSSPTALRLGQHSHILGPHGEGPIWSTISIEAPSATLADALSTAAVFMTTDRLRRLKSDAKLSRITAISPDGDLITL